MKVATICSALLGALLCPLVHAADFETALEYDSEVAAVVRIYVTRGATNERFIGAGTFISAEGDILTAYHVVQGAKGIEVLGKAGPYPRPTLVSYDENRDLAILHVDRPKGDSAILPIGAVPAGIVERQSHAYGHPDGKLNFRIAVDVNRNGTMKSQEYLGPGASTVFAVSDVDILPIDGTLDRGMSGGPLIHDGKIIGVISGTLSPSGRSLGWAMLAQDSKKLKAAGGKSFADAPKLAMLAPGQSPPLLKAGEVSDRWKKLDDSQRLLARLEPEAQVYALEDLAMKKQIEALQSMPGGAVTTEMISAFAALFKAAGERHNASVAVASRLFEEIFSPLSKESNKDLETLDEAQVVMMTGWKAQPLIDERDLIESLQKQQDAHRKVVELHQDQVENMRERLQGALNGQNAAAAVKKIIDDHILSIRRMDSGDREIVSTSLKLCAVELVLYEKTARLKSRTSN